MTSPDEWDSLIRTWRSGRDASPAGLAAHLKQHRARVRRTRRTELLLAGTGVLGIAAALVHTHDLIDIISAAICVSGLLTLLLTGRRGDDEEAALTDSTADFLGAEARRQRRLLGAVRLVIAALALDLLFFVPWWIGGFQAHRAEFDSWAEWAAWWFPMLLMCFLAAWAAVVRARLRVSVRRLDDLHAAHIAE
jgi:hypothetical protein